MGDGVRSPDLTIGELVEEAEGTEFEEMRQELDYVIRQAKKVRDNEITLADYENRLSAYEVKKGGRLEVESM